MSRTRKVRLPNVEVFWDLTLDHSPEWDHLWRLLFSDRSSSLESRESSRIDVVHAGHETEGMEEARRLDGTSA